MTTRAELLQSTSWTSSPSGNTGPQEPVVLPSDALWMSARQVRARRGGCAPMTLDRLIKNDPDFPRPVYFGRLRFFKLADIEAYERLCEVRAAAKRLNSND
jgi:predicted DNA-binding transcriptional regulator AlpA